MKNLVLDFDGVLGDTFEVSVDFLVKNFRISPESAKKRLIKSGMKNTKDRFIRRKITSWYYQKLLKYLEDKKDLTFTDRLEELKKIKTEKAILTRSETSICELVLHNYLDQFEIIVGRNNSKSKVDGLNKISELEGFNLENIIFVTDSVGDFLELSEVLERDQIFLVSWGFHSREIIQKNIPDQKIIDSFLELEKYL
jgi:phosphoglycolate phosphatase-like HAD superfamily hydrolase